MPSQMQIDAAQEVMQCFVNGRSDLNRCIYIAIGCLGTLFDPLGLRDEDVPVNDCLKDDSSLSGIVTRTSRITVTWATMVRTGEELARLKHFACKCTDHTRTTNQWHQIGVTHVMRVEPCIPFWHLLILTLQPYMRFQAQESTDSKSATTLSRLKHRRIWPTNTEDLLPHGPRNTVHGLVQWLTIQPDHEVRYYVIIPLRALLSVCHPLVVSYMAQSKLLLTCGFMDGIAWHSFFFFNTTAIDITMPARYLYHTIEFFALMSAHSTDTERRSFWSSYPKRSLRSCVEAKRVIDHIEAHPIWLETMSSADTLLCLMAEDLVTDFPCLRMYLADTHYAGMVFASGQELVQNSLAHLVHVLAMSTRCSNYVCDNTPAHGRMGRCYGCRTTMYCSRRCQKAAWRFLSAPHRETCGLLGPVVLAYRMRGSVPRIDVEQAQAILNHQQALDEARAHHQSECRGRLFCSNTDTVRNTATCSSE
jgi:hypothetical protein